jgi:hypothetical protein
MSDEVPDVDELACLGLHEGRFVRRVERRACGAQLGYDVEVADHPGRQNVAWSLHGPSNIANAGRPVIA